MEISPSILSADIFNLESNIIKIQNEINYLHVDIMDGNFVPNLSFGSNIVKSLKSRFNFILDVHLMVDHPEFWIDKFYDAGADIIGVHYESTSHVHRALSMIKKNGLKSEVVLNPGSPVNLIVDLLPLVDQVLVMTVDPGFGGQSFLSYNLSKVKQLYNLRKEKNLRYKIEVDGGVTDKNIKKCYEAGADIAVSGSYIFNSLDPNLQIKKLKTILV